MIAIVPLLAALCACQPRQAALPTKEAPTVGVTASAQGQNSAVIEALERAGADPVLLLPGLGSPRARVGALDGLVLAGGADLDPALYGEVPHPSLMLETAARQQLDLELAREALALDLPVLGICLGAQELAVLAGGALIQDIPSERPEALDHAAVHPIDLVEGTPLAALHDSPTVEVYSLHHQAVDGAPPGHAAAAWAPDGVLEAFWDPTHRFVLGVQYHPEQETAAAGQHAALWAALVEQAAHRNRAAPELSDRAP
jgi:putative glutamine amidotransferase